MQGTGGTRDAAGTHDRVKRFKLFECHGISLPYGKVAIIDLRPPDASTQTAGIPFQSNALILP
jgi:hypothetical protein